MANLASLRSPLAVVLLTLTAGQLMGMACTGSHEAVGHQTFTSPQSNPIALSADKTNAPAFASACAIRALKVSAASCRSVRALNQIESLKSAARSKARSS